MKKKIREHKRIKKGSLRWQRLKEKQTHQSPMQQGASYLYGVKQKIKEK